MNRKAQKLHITRNIFQIVKSPLFITSRNPPIGSSAPSFTSKITVPDSRARTVCHWPMGMFRATTDPPGREFQGLPTEHEKDFPIPRAGWRGRIWTRMAPRYRACSYPGAVSANPRVPGGWNRFKDRKFSGRLPVRPAMTSVISTSV